MATRKVAPGDNPNKPKVWNNRVYARGYKGVSRPRPVEDRLWPRVTKTETCWLWHRAEPHGYGKISVNGRHEYVHRVVYEMLRGPIPEGMQIDHLCRNKLCCNPDHLEPVTRKENLARGIDANAAKRNQSHCKNGHEWAPPNLRVASNGRRFCKPCADARRRAKRARQRARGQRVT